MSIGRSQPRDSSFGRWTPIRLDVSLFALSKAKKRQKLALEATTSAESKTHLPAGRRWWFRLIAIVGIPTLFVLSAEGFLQLVGYGYSPHFFQKRIIQGRAVWTENPQFGRRFFPPSLARYPQSFTIPVEKAPGTLRIFVLGESAAMGDPDFKFGLPRMLEVLLRERFPNRRIEVVNAAMVAINSHVILPIARDCAALQADLWVIYMGNNEMVGPFGSASVFGSQAPALPLIRAGLWMKETRFGQFLDTAVGLVSAHNPNSSEWSGMEMMAEQKVRRNTPATQRVYRHFERNLKDLLATGVRAGVPMILCTVASNLKDCAPFASLHRRDLQTSDLAQWQAAYDQAVTYQTSSDLANASAAYEKAWRIDCDFAELAFRRGQCCHLAGKNAEAEQLFQKARDEDALQFRADGEINDLIRHSAAMFSDRGVGLLDAEALFATNSPQNSPGAEYFYEHVHLTPEGNYLLAHAVAEQVIKALSSDNREQWISQSECLRLLGFTDWNRYDALNIILDRIQRAPFTNQANHMRQMELLQEQLAHYRLATKPAQVKRELQQVSQMVARYPQDADLRWNLATLLEAVAEMDAAREQWRTLLHLQPQSAWPLFNLARFLEGNGEQAEATSVYEQGLRINPEYYPAQFSLGSLYLRMGRLPDAARHFKRALQLRPRSIEARLALGQGLSRAHKSADAEKQFQQVLHLDPNNEAARAELKSLQKLNP